MIAARKIRTFWSSGPDGRAMFAEAFFLPLLISAGFRLAGVPRTQAALRRWSAAFPKPDSRVPEAVILDAVRAQRTIRRTLKTGGSCLVRSLSLWALLLRRGIPTDLRVGYRKKDGAMEGHAWLEYGGNPINEEPAVAGTYCVQENLVAFDRLLARLAR